MPYPAFDRARLRIQPLAQREHDLDLSVVMPLDAGPPPWHDPAIPKLAERIITARQHDAAVILVMGAHVLRAGTQRFLIDLMERKLVTHVAMNGAGPIHDWEM